MNCYFLLHNEHSRDVVSVHTDITLTVSVLLTGSSAPGIPSEEEFVSTYCKLSGLGDTPFLHWNYYLALSFFRMAAIAQVNNFQLL